MTLENMHWLILVIACYSYSTCKSHFILWCEKGLGLQTNQCHFIDFLKIGWG